MPRDLDPDLDPMLGSDLDADLDPVPENCPVSPSVRRKPRRDGMALGFGVAFIIFGVLGLARAAGAAVPSAWLYPIILIGLGVAGLVSAFARERR
ncbi:MAG TPA: hypothetical protein VMG12_25900 [Polyangiaceae bacterium]|nr:hypothetical protein [Polyangiaceae bacterium]